jgi:outer membrane murein-binding lipoprotein Lpp
MHPKNSIAISARAVLGAATTAAALLTAGPVSAASQDDLSQVLSTLDAQRAKLDQQDQLLRQQSEQLQQQQQELDRLRSRFEQLPQPIAIKVPPPRVSAPLSAETLGSLRGGAGETAQADQAPVGQAPATPERAPQLDLLTDRGGVLTPRGAFVYEPTIDFVHTSSNSAVIQGTTIIPAITVGAINISKINQDLFQAVNTFRFGVTDRFEIEARVPFVYGRQEAVQRPLNVQANSDLQFNTQGAGIGDVEGAAHYQINRGEGGWPYFIANVRVKTETGKDAFSISQDPNSGLPSRVPTGSGFYDVEPSLTLIYPSDPAVFFLNAGYIFGIPQTKGVTSLGGVGNANIDPGSAIHFSFGLGFGINEASSFSIGYDYSSFSPQVIKGGGIVPQGAQVGTSLQIGSVLIGYSYRFNDRIAVNLTTGIGTTADAPNTHVILRVPIQFQVFGR